MGVKILSMTNQSKRKAAKSHTLSFEKSL